MEDGGLGEGWLCEGENEGKERRCGIEGEGFVLNLESVGRFGRVHCFAGSFWSLNWARGMSILE